jgi:hypothetical protein
MRAMVHTESRARVVWSSCNAFKSEYWNNISNVEYREWSEAIYRTLISLVGYFVMSLNML